MITTEIPQHSGYFSADIISKLITLQGDLSVALTNSATLEEVCDVAAKMISRIPCVDAVMVCLQQCSELTILTQQGFSPAFLVSLNHFSSSAHNLWMTAKCNDPAQMAISLCECLDIHCLFDIPILSTDGKTWILCIAFREIDKSVCITAKSIESAVSQIQEHTERIERETAIKHKLEMLEGFFNSTDDALTMQDAQGRFLMVNETVASRFNTTVQDLIGKTLFDIIPADLAAKRDQIGKMVFETAKRTRIQDKRDSFYFDTILAPILGENGKVTAVAAYNRDVTSLKKVEMALRESQEKLQTILKTSPAAIGLFDENGFITFANESMGLLFNIECLELQGIHYLDLVHPEERSQGRDMMTALINNDVDTVNLDRRYQKKDGGWFVGHISGRRITRDEGDLVGLVGIIEDVTERRKSEEKLKQSLEHKEILLQEIHHRVKNNLSMIKSLLRLQRRHSEKAEILDILDSAQNRIDSMSLAYEMLYASDDLELISSQKYLHKLLQFIIGTYDQTARHISVNTQIDDVNLDVDIIIPLGFIVTELVTNCFKHAFSDDRSGKIVLCFRKISEKDFELSVEDNGVGLSTVYSPEHSQSMGLNLVRVFAQQLGSGLSISSNNGTQAHLILKDLES